MEWFRWYAGTHSKPKFRALRPDWRCLFIALGETACDQENGGLVSFLPGVPFTAEQLADLAAIPVEQVEPGLSRLVDYGWIERREDGIFLTGWVERQYLQSDKSTARVQKHRQAKRAGNDDETGVKQLGNADETVMKRSGNGDETASENREQSSEQIHPAGAKRAQRAEVKESPQRKAALAYVLKFNSNWHQAGDDWEQLLEYGDDLENGWPLVVEAVKECASAGTNSLEYCLAVLSRWKKDGITTKEQVVADRNRHQVDKAKAAQRTRGTPGGQGRQPERSNVRWTPKDGKPKDPDRYAHIYKKFEDDPDPPKGESA